MMSVAAVALIAGAGFAHAQGTGMGREGSSAGSAAQQSAPSSGNSAASTNRSGGETTPSTGMKATQSDEKSPGAAKNQRAEDKDMQGQKSKSMSSENEGAKGSKDMKAEGREGHKDMKAEGREGRTNAQGREGQNTNMNAEQKGAADSRSQTTTQSQTGQSQTTTGQAGAGAKLSTEQRTKITTVIRDQHVEPLNNVNFSISVGTRVPRDVRFHPLPQDVVTVYPQWRGYEFVLVKNQIVVVDPHTFEIVAVLDA
jgi:hypothetical protein